MPSPGDTHRLHEAVGSVNAVDAWAEPQIAVWWPYLAVRLSLGDTGLTVLQLALSLPWIVGALLGATIAERSGARPVLRVGVVLMYGGYVGALLAPSSLVAACCLGASGLANGVYNVAQRASNVAVETRGGPRHTLAYTATCSLTVALGSAVAGVLASVGPVAHLGLMLALAVVLIMYVTGTATLPDLRRNAAPAAPLAWPSILPLVGVAALSTVPIGVAYTRGAVIMTDLGAGGGLRAGALAAYAACEVATLLAVYRLGPAPATVARLGGVVAVAGSALLCAVALGVGGWLAALLALGLVGAGLACITPLAYSIAGERFAHATVRAAGRITTVNLLAVASAPLLVLTLAACGVGSTLAAGVLVLACSVGVLVWAPRTFTIT